MWLVLISIAVDVANGIQEECVNSCIVRLLKPLVSVTFILLEHIGNGWYQRADKQLSGSVTE